MSSPLLGRLPASLAASLQLATRKLCCPSCVQIPRVVSTAAAGSKRFVTLNVGGHRFLTAATTLAAAPGSYFAKLAQQATAGRSAGASEFFVDRSGKVGTAPRRCRGGGTGLYLVQPACRPALSALHPPPPQPAPAAHLPSCFFLLPVCFPPASFLPADL